MDAATPLLVDGREYPLDDHGFLARPEAWDTCYAEEMARRIDMPGDLTVLHWRIILHVRNCFLREDRVARIHETCRKCRVSLGRLRQLFPPGYQRGVCRLAGIPYDFIASRHAALTYETHTTRGHGCGTVPPGFLLDIHSWDHGFARMAAKQSRSRALTPRHWEIIEYLRNQFLRTGRLPTLVTACRDTGLTLDEWNELFPDGYRHGPWLLGGLPPSSR